MGQVVTFPIAARPVPPAGIAPTSITGALIDLLEQADRQGDDTAFDAVHEAWIRLQHAKLWRARIEAAKGKGAHT